MIVGAPGAGKTVLAYKLVDYLDRQCAADPAAALPIVLNLASWRPGLSIVEWLVERLCDPHTGYGFPGSGLSICVSLVG